MFGLKEMFVVKALQFTDMRVNVLLIFCASLSSIVRGDSFIKPCTVGDTDCMIRNSNEFLSKTSKGIPEYDMQTIDPLVISSTEFRAPDESRLIFHYKNLNVTGLKDQKFTYCILNLTHNYVVLRSKADLNVVGDVTVELNNYSKTFSGTFTLSGKVECTIKYNISSSVDDKGVSHFIPGPEELACQALDGTVLTIGPELEQAFLAHPEVKEAREKNKDKTQAFRKESLSHIADKSYAALIHNLRAALKSLPASDFLVGA